MNQANKLRDEAARLATDKSKSWDYVTDFRSGFVAGAEWTLEHDPRVQRLVEALGAIKYSLWSENLEKQSVPHEIATSALKAWKVET